MVFLIVGLVLAGVLFVAVESGAILGLIAAATGRHLERCERCHSYGLTRRGLVHPADCPPHREHVHRPAHWPHPLHALAVVHERHQQLHS
jgi:hypothetical protein